MTLEIDLHVHTTHSGSARFTIPQLAEEGRRRRLTHVAVTDSGSADGVAELRSSHAGCVVPGVELATEEGHFLVFCEDLAFLRSLGGYVRSISAVPDRADSAVVWAHPWAYTPDGSRRAPRPEEPLARAVLPHVHAIEVCNGNMAIMMGGEMLSKTYVGDVVGLARSAGKGMVGGSDAHDPERFFLCRTEILLTNSFRRGKADELPGPAAVVRAIRTGLVRPETSIPLLRSRLAAALNPAG